MMVVMLGMASVIFMRFGDLAVGSEYMKLSSENVALFHVKCVLIVFKLLKLYISETLRPFLC